MIFFAEPVHTQWLLLQWQKPFMGRTRQRFFTAAVVAIAYGPEQKNWKQQSLQRHGDSDGIFFEKQFILWFSSKHLGAAMTAPSFLL